MLENKKYENQDMAGNLSIVAIKNIVSKEEK